MFIYCVDEQLKTELINKGFKLLNQDKDKAVFIMDKNLKFNFDRVDKSKFLFTNKLQF